MTTQEAVQIKEKYDLYDTNFRSAKSKKDFKKAAEWKAKRDELSQKLQEAIVVLKN